VPPAIFIEGDPMYLIGAYLLDAYLMTINPLIEVPVSYASNEKAVISLNKTVLAGIDVVQNHPIFSEQAQWAKVNAIYENINISFGDTDRITGSRFRGSNTLQGKFKADAESGHVYKLKRIYIRDENSNSLRINRTDLENPDSMDITVS